MKILEDYFLSSDNKTNIHMVEFVPDTQVIGIIQVIHGVTEHIMRYKDFAEYFTGIGYLVVGIDLIGHGLSTNNGRIKMYFGREWSFNYVVEDVNTCLKMTKEKYSNVPYYMLGFSLGSFVLREHLIKYPGSITGAIIVGTGMTSPFLLSMVRNIAIREGKKNGEENTTPKIKELTFGTYNKKFMPNKTDFDWLLKDEGALNTYIHDSLRGEALSAGLFREMLSAMIFTAKKKNISKMNRNTRILLLSGADDPVGDFKKGVIKTYNAFSKAGIVDLRYKIYDGLRHDILHELDRLVIYNDINNWINKKDI